MCLTKPNFPWLTEPEVHREHPEAVKIEETRVVIDLPTTEAEIQAFQRERRTP